MGKLEGKIALITGGNSGIGLATAKRFVTEGAYVFITGRRDRELAAVKEVGKNLTGVQGDVSNLSDLDRLFAQIKREKGKLDVVFANAGVAKYAPCWAHGSIVWPSTRPRRGSEYANDASLRRRGGSDRHLPSVGGRRGACGVVRPRDVYRRSHHAVGPPRARPDPRGSRR